MGLRRPQPASRAVGTAPVPTVDRCDACRRTGIDLENRVLDDGSVGRVCITPTPCRRHWAPEDQPRGIR